MKFGDIKYYKENFQGELSFSYEPYVAIYCKSAKAAYNIYLFLRDNFTDKNIRECALSFCKYAADHGSKEAANDIGVLLSLIGDDELAEKYLLQSASQENLMAFANLGAFYEGEGKFEEAEKWLELFLLKVADDEYNSQADENLIFTIRNHYANLKNGTAQAIRKMVDKALDEVVAHVKNKK